tara:strand:- start:2501 stop:2764 length:264 start_codon:yes stop_codon:yes gene_type:complete
MKGKKMTNFKINNGDMVKSETTGITGVITARSDHLHGCNRYFVQPKAGKDNKYPDGYWFDEEDLLVTKSAVVQQGRTDRGGPPSRLK